MDKKQAEKIEYSKRKNHLILKRYCKYNIKEQSKLLKDTFEYEYYLLSGKYTDKLSKLKASFVFGTIDEATYNLNKKQLEEEKLKVLKEYKEEHEEKIKGLNEKFEKILKETNTDTAEFKPSDYIIPRQNRLLSFLRAFKNKTFTYFLRRILMSIITLILIISFVIILLSFIPDRNLYSIQQYNKIAASSVVQAERWKDWQLYTYGRMTIDGSYIPWYRQILQFLYYIAPFPKSIPFGIDANYHPTDYHTVFIYFGQSITYHESISSLINKKMGISFTISICVLLLNYIIAYPFGVAMAKKPGGFVDKLGNLFIVLNYAIPALIFYLFINQIFGAGIGGFSFGYIYSDQHPIISIIPPILAVTFLGIPGSAIWVRRFMIDQLTSDYVKYAKAKGLSSSRILYTHVLRNAIVPLVRGIPAAFIFAIVGSYFVEQIWNIPGTGRLLVLALTPTSPDIPLILGLTTIYSGMSMLSFILGDLLTVFTDPRIKLSRG